MGRRSKRSKPEPAEPRLTPRQGRTVNSATVTTCLISSLFLIIYRLSSYKLYSSHEDFLLDAFARTFEPIAPEEAVARVGRGLGLSTHLASYIIDEGSKGKQFAYAKDMVDAGVVSVALEHLNKCGEAF